MIKTLLAGAVYALIALSASAQESIYTDEVVVTANRIPQARQDVLADVSVIEREEIERAGQNTLVELLQRQPGVQITSTGGPGKVSGVFLRGTNTSQTVVLVDGMRMNSATVGTTSLENLPLSQIERIEILRGPASSMYGADAIGGVIQIFTKRGGATNEFSAFVGYGRYRTIQTEAAASGSIKDTRYSVNVSTMNTDGFSAYETNKGYDADNDGYRNQAVSASLERTIAPGHTLGLQFFQSTGHNDYDCYYESNGFVFTDGRVCKSQQTLRSYSLSSQNWFLPTWFSSFRIGEGVDDYENSSGLNYSPGLNYASGKISHDKALTKQFQATWQNDLTLPVGTLVLAYDRLQQRVDARTEYAVNSRGNNGWLGSYLADIGNHSVRASLRLDDNTQYSKHTTGGASYGYRFTPRWRASASYGTAFKAPDFAQLYYPQSGNPDLKPETSRNIEVALRFESANLRGGLVAFHNQIDNLIASSPSTFWIPDNIAKATIKGVTLDAIWMINREWTLQGNLTVQSPRNDNTGNLLIQRGQQQGTLNLAWQSGATRIGAEMVSQSHRYNDAENTIRLGGYTLFNLTASYAINSSWGIEARADNVFDKHYVLASAKVLPSIEPGGLGYPNYNTPGANLFVGVRWQPK